MTLKGVADLLNRLGVGLLAHVATGIGEEVNLRLEILLKAFLLHEHRKIFAESGPLGTFYSRIEMAAALGLISSTERHDLNLIRKIRNDMAHYPPVRPGQRALSFDDDKIKSRCAQLKTPSQYDERFGDHGSGRSPEQLFIKAFLSLVAALNVRTRHVVRCQAPGPITESEFRTAISAGGESELKDAAKEFSEILIDLEQLILKKFNVAEADEDDEPKH